MENLSMRLWKTFWLYSLVTTISCSSIQENKYSWKQRDDDLITASEVSFQARTVLNKNGSSYHLNIFWEQKKEHFYSQGIDFFGQQVFSIMGDQLHAQLVSGDGEKKILSRTFFQQQFGIDADPLTVLNLLRAVQVDNATVVFKNNLMQRQKLGPIQVIYKSYIESQGYLLPSAVSIQIENISLKMAIHSWQHQLF